MHDLLPSLLDLLTTVCEHPWRIVVCIGSGLAAAVAFWWLVPDSWCGFGGRCVVAGFLFLIAAFVGTLWELGRSK